MSIHRVTIRRFDPATWKADVELAGAPMALLTNVPVAAGLGEVLLAPGSRAWMWLEGGGNPADAVVLAPEGAPRAWVTSRLWRPTVASVALAAPAACASPSFVAVPGLSVDVAVEVESSVLLLLAAAGTLAPGAVYSAALYHDDAHEASQLAPVATLAAEHWALSWLALQAAVAPGTHTFAVRHAVAGSGAVVDAARLVAIAAA